MIEVSKWFTENALMLNSKATKIIKFQSYQSRQPVEMSVNLRIQNLFLWNEQNFWDFTLTNHLNWKTYQNNRRKNSILYVFKWWSLEM